MTQPPTIESLAARVRELEAVDATIRYMVGAKTGKPTVHEVIRVVAERDAALLKLKQAKATLAAIESAVAAAKKESQGRL